MASQYPFEFQVNRSEPELITPATPTPYETKLLSDIDDQQGAWFHLPVIMSYKGNSSIYQNDPVKVIREALSKALVHYYPLAGRLRKGPNKKLTVDCNGEGVMFIEADADVTLEQLGDTIQPPCPILEEFLWNVPGYDGIIGCPLMLAQVTRLTCGGCIFALRLNHTMCDGMGLSQFLIAVAEMAQGADSPSILPVWERELLLARDPPQITHRHYEYEPIIHSEGTPTIAIDPANLIHRSFCFGPKEIRALRRQLPPHLSTSSRFELITACVLKCRTMSLNMKPDEIIRLTCAVNARGKHENGVIPTGFYGNAFGIPTAVSTVQLVCESPLGYAVELVKESKAKMDGEYIRSFADYLVVKGKPPLPMTWNVLLVSDNTRAGYGEFDFGWGRPVFAGPPRAVNLISFYVRDNNQQEKYGVLVPMCLPKSCIETFEGEFRRMTSNPVEDV